MKEKVIELLNRYIYLKAEIKSIDIEIEELKSNCGMIGSILYEERVSTSGPVGSIVEKEVLLKENKISKLMELKKFKDRKVRKIDAAIEILDEIEKDIITYRYFKRNKWKIIAKKLDRTEVRCMQIHSSALDKIKDIIFVGE